MFYLLNHKLFRINSIQFFDEIIIKILFTSRSNFDNSCAYFLKTTELKSKKSFTWFNDYSVHTKDIEFTQTITK